MTVFLDRDLACKIEDDVREGNKQVIEAWNKSGFCSTAKSIEVGNSLSVYGGSECPINETIGLGMMSPVEESVLEEIEEFYHSNNHASVIRVCPLAHATLVQLTQKSGYILNSFSYRWVLDLGQWQFVFDSVDLRVRTAPSYRKWGLQTALIDWRLRLAKEHGAPIATLETDPGSDSQRNAERIGFRLAYVIIT